MTGLAVQLNKELAEVKSVEQGLKFDDKLAALQKYFANEAEETEKQIACVEARARLHRLIWDEVQAMRDRGDIQMGAGRTHLKSLSDIGVDKRKADQCRAVSAISEMDFELEIARIKDAGKDAALSQFVKKGKSILKAADNAGVQRENTADGCEISDLESCDLKFGTICADPPWVYGNQSTRAATGNHYSGMSVDEICEMPVERLAADVSHLHLWTTNGFLPDAFKVMEAWGFEYKSCFVWVKPQMGIGNYWRVSHEFMLLGTRGSCVFADKSLMSWGAFNRTKHSAKPDEIRRMIEKGSPGKRLELFARRLSPGWVSWGNEIERTMFDEAVATA